MSDNVRTREFTVSLPIGLTDHQGNFQRDIVLRKMTGREEAILADRKYQRNGGRLVTELLHSCIVRLGTLAPNGRGPVTNMTSADRNYPFLQLRSITFGSELEAAYTCPACAERLQLTENLDELPVHELPEGEDRGDVAVELEDG